MSKYRAKPTTVDGIRFASKKEASRYLELCLLQKAGEISLLQLQPAFVLEVSGTKVGRYVADFSYRDKKTGKIVYEDVKGFKTPVYRLKKKLVKAQYGIDILET